MSEIETESSVERPTMWIFLVIIQRAEMVVLVAHIHKTHGKFTSTMREAVADVKIQQWQIISGRLHGRTAELLH